MKSFDWKSYFLLFLIIVATTGVNAAEEKAAPAKTEEAASSTPDPQKETLSETSHSVKIDGKEIQYRALAGGDPAARSGTETKEQNFLRGISPERLSRDEVDHFYF